MFDFTTTGTRKEVNTTTGATITSTPSPTSGSRGAPTTNFGSTYTIATATTELTVNDAQSLFSPAFLLLPANKKCTYTITGNSLKVTSTYYDAPTRHREVTESTFTK